MDYAKAIELSIRLSLLTAPFAGMLYAQPKGANCVFGKADIAALGGELSIKTGGKTIINWESFSIDPNEITRFIQTDSGAAVLNRVIGNLPSSIQGTLKGNGSVFLINSNGILIGSHGVIDVGNFIASTFDVLDEEFIVGTTLLFKGSSKASIVNLGSIKAWNGDALLIGYRLDNQGLLEAPNGVASLAAGWEVLVKPAGKERIFIRPSTSLETRDGSGIINSGTVTGNQIELKADGNPYALAIKDNGLAEARATQFKDGKIYLVADQGRVEIDGSLFAPSGEIQLLGDQVLLDDGARIDVSGPDSGGSVYIGGGFQGKDPTLINSSATYVAPGALILADSLEEGNGGKVVVWSDQTTAFKGRISARGGPLGGNGGNAEVSGIQQLGFQGIVDLIAPLGMTGTLLLDPCDLLISDQLSTGGSLTPAPPYGGATPTITATGPGCILNNTDLQTALGFANVIVQTGGSCVASGDITVQAMIPATPLSVNSANDLTLNATNDINILSPLDNSMSGSFTLIAGHDIVFGLASQMQTQPCTLTGQGNMTLTADNNISFYGGNGIGANSALFSTGGPGILYSITATNGTINLQGGTALGTSAFIDSGPGGINLTANGVMTQTGGSALGSSAIITGGDNIHLIAGGLTMTANNGGAQFSTPFGGNVIIDLNVAGGANSLSLTGGVETLNPADASILTGNGNITITTIGNSGANSGSISLIGGSVATPASNLATINCTGGNLTIQTTGGIGTNSGNISITAGDFTLCGANMVSSNNIDIRTIDRGNLSITSGNASTSPAFIASDGSSINTLTLNIAGTISVTSVLDFANIKTSADASIDITSTGAITVQSGTGSGSVASIETGMAGGNVDIQSSALTLAGGSFASTGAVAQIFSPSDVSITTTSGSIRLGASAGTGSTRIQGTAGTVTINSGLDLILEAPLNAMTSDSFSEIKTTTGNLSISVGNNLSLTAGGGTGNYAAIYSPVNTILFPSVVQDVDLLGGSASGAIAHIGSPFQATASSAITFTSIGGNVNLSGGSGSGNSWAQIGHNNQTGMPPASTFSGSIIFTDVGGDILVQGGTGTFSFAQIGHGNPSLSGNTIDGSVRMFLGGTLTAAGGSGTSSYALIGHGGNSGSTTLDTFGSVSPLPRFDVEAGFIIVEGGTNTNNFGAIGIVGAPNSVAHINSIGIVSELGPTTLQAGGGTNNNATIGAFFTNGTVGGTTTFTALSSILLISAQDLVIRGSLTGGNFAALGVDSGNPDGSTSMHIPIIATAGGDVSLQAGPNLGSDAYIRNFKGTVVSTDLLAVSANIDILMTTGGGGLSFMSSIGALTTIVDNAFPGAAGPGLFSLAGTSFLETQGGAQLKLYTSKRSQNSLLGTINGIDASTFIPSTALFVDDNYEKWCVSSPGGTYGGPEFTIFYKECNLPPSTATVIPPIPIVEATRLNDELFYDLESYTFWDIHFSVNYNRAADFKNLPYREMIAKIAPVVEKKTPTFFSFMTSLFYNRYALLKRAPYREVLSSYDCIIDRNYWKRLPEHYEKNGRNKNSF